MWRAAGDSVHHLWFIRLTHLVTLFFFCSVVNRQTMVEWPNKHFMHCVRVCVFFSVFRSKTFNIYVQLIPLILWCAIMSQYQWKYHYVRVSESVCSDILICSTSCVRFFFIIIAAIAAIGGADVPEVLYADRWALFVCLAQRSAQHTAHMPGHQTKIERKLSGDASRRAVKKKKSNEFYFCFDSLFCSQIKIMPIL